MAYGPINLVGHTDVVMATVFNPDGTRLISGGWDQMIKVWNVVHAAEEATLRGHTNSIWSLATSRDGLRLASGSGDFTIKLWDLSSFTELKTFAGHTEAVYSVAMSYDGTVLVSASSDGTARVWEPHSGAQIAKLVHPYPVRCLTLSRDGTLLITSCDQKYTGQPPTSNLTFWDVPTGKQIGVASGAVIRDSLALTSDGRKLAVGLVEGSFDSEPPDVGFIAELWDVVSQKMQVRWRAHDSNIRSLSFTEDGRRLASGSYDTNVKIWTVDDHQLKATFHDQRYWVDSVAISGDGWWLASGGGQSHLSQNCICGTSANKE